MFFRESNTVVMVSAKKGKKEDNLEVVEHALSRTEHFIEENQKMITIVVLALIVVVGIWLGFKRLIVAPREKDAQDQMFVAEQYFEKDSFNLALNGDGNFLGFLDILDEYKITKAADLASYYSGICYLRLGQYKTSIDYLEKFKTKDKILRPMATGAKGDANLELGEQTKAINLYLKAARDSKNSFTTPIFLQKAAILLQDQEKYGQAIELYKEIQSNYPNSNEGRLMDKYIARAEALMNMK